MHGNTKIKFVNAKQAKTYYNYKNNKRKMYRISAAIWYNKKCKINGITPNYINTSHVHLPVSSACTLYDAPEDGCTLHLKHVEQKV